LLDDAGMLAAAQMRDTVQQCIEANPDIEAHAKIIVRAFYNQGGSKGNPHVDSQQFARRFTESMPLFDFCDAGSGKERADVKIRGL
jgi:hypothetical protein